MSKVVMWGCGKIAEVIAFYITTDSEHEIAAYCVDKEYLSDDIFLGCPVVAFSDLEKVYPPEEFKMIIPAGYKKMNRIRAEKYQQAKEKGYSFISYISTKAAYYGSEVGENTIILENNVIQPYTVIGNNTILWSGNHIGHHARIGDHCFISSHVVISGSAVIGDYTFMGVNSTVRDNITIGESSLIGAGAVIMHSTDADSVYIPPQSVKRDDIKKL